MNKQELIEEIKGLRYHNASKRLWVDRELVLDLVEQLDEPKVTIPQFVADWIEEGKKHCKDVSDLFDFDFTNEEVGNWFLQEKPFDLVARAWLDGYEVEQEKRYLVKMKGVSSNMCYLNRVGNKWIIAGIDEHTGMNIYTKHTRKQLEEAGFGWVFDCEGMEVEEV